MRGERGSSIVNSNVSMYKRYPAGVIVLADGEVTLVGLLIGRKLRRNYVILLNLQRRNMGLRC